MWSRTKAASLLALLVIVSGLSGLSGAAPNAQADAAREFARTLQLRYAGIRSFTAEFTLGSTSGALKRTVTEHGTVSIEKPGKMRWEYRKPSEDKLLVSDGLRSYIYLPRDKQVQVTRVAADDSPTSPVLFLAGKGDLVRDFTPQIVEPPAALKGTRALKLTPTRPQADYEWMIIAVDPESLSLRGLVFRDAQGGTQTLILTNLRENVRIPDSRFEFQIPPGVQVLN